MPKYCFINQEQLNRALSTIHGSKVQYLDNLVTVFVGTEFQEKYCNKLINQLLTEISVEHCNKILREKTKCQSIKTSLRTIRTVHE